MCYCASIAEWTFLTNHARALLCIARDPTARLRDIAASLGITERRAHAIVTDLVDAGYVIKARDGRRNTYEIRHHVPLGEATGRESTVGELVELLAGVRPTAGRPRRTRTSGPARTHATARRS